MIQDHLALTAVIALEAGGETPARTKHVYAGYRTIATAVDADTIALRRVRDHLQDLDLAGIVRGQTKNTGLQGGAHYRWDLNADFRMTLDVFQETDRFGNVMDLITD